jgi:hypothetical protein
MSNTWEEVLGTLEAELEALRAVVDDLDREPHVPRFVPPADLGPLPPALADRAIRLSGAYEAALERANGETARLHQELQQVARRQVEQPRGQARIDVQG